MILKLSYGDVEIELYPDKAPNHVKRFKELSESGKYDGVVFHRVIEGFMAQTGDVQFGNSNSKDFNLNLAGTGGSNLPNVKAEFTDVAHTRGTISAARSAAVADYLLGGTELQQGRVMVAGFADTRPLGPNDTAEGRARNRRIEIIVDGD